MPLILEGKARTEVHKQKSEKKQIAKVNRKGFIKPYSCRIKDLILSLVGQTGFFQFLQIKICLLLPLLVAEAYRIALSATSYYICSSKKGAHKKCKM